MIQKRIRTITEEFVKSCEKQFGKNLECIVLFGSYARGTAAQGSDIDILVIAKNLPKNMFERLNLMDDFIMNAIKKYYVRIMPLFYEPDEFFNEKNMLLYGVLTGYNILFGESEWNNYLASVKSTIEEINPEYIEGGKSWMAAELI